MHPGPVLPCESCRRTVPAEELVRVGDRLLCAPCQEEGAKADERRDSIDAAWAAVEASVPKGWKLVDLALEYQPEWRDPQAIAVASATISRIRTSDDDRFEETTERGKAPTPAQALRQLATTLSGAG